MRKNHYTEYGTLICVNLNMKEINILIAGMAIGAAKAAHSGINPIDFDRIWCRPSTKLAHHSVDKYGHDFLESRETVSNWRTGLLLFIEALGSKYTDAVELLEYLENVIDGWDCEHDF